MISVFFGKMILQVECLHHLEIKFERKAEEEDKMKKERADQEPDGMPTKDTDCKSHRADVEDDTGEEQGEKVTDSSEQLKFLCYKVFQLLHHANHIFFFFLVLESDKLS